MRAPSSIGGTRSGQSYSQRVGVGNAKRKPAGDEALLVPVTPDAPKGTNISHGEGVLKQSTRFAAVDLVVKRLVDWGRRRIYAVEKLALRLGGWAPSVCCGRSIPGELGMPEPWTGQGRERVCSQ